MLAQQWQQAIVILAATMVAATVAMALYWAQIIFVPVTLPIFLAFLLRPPVRFVERHGVHGGIAVPRVVGMVLLFVGEMGWLITRQVGSLVKELPDYSVNVQKKVE